MKQTKMGHLEGILKRHPDGFGFVIPDDKNHPDIYIPSTKIGSALTNDRVEVVVYQKIKGGPRSYFGFIRNILKRDKEFVVGFFEIKKDQAFIRDHNLAYPDPIPLKNPQKIPVKIGDYVKAKIQFQNQPALKKSSRAFKPALSFKAELSKNLGPLNSSAKDDVKRIMADNDISFDFPLAVLQEARELPNEVREKDYLDREDLRQKAFVTIDGATAQDFDDAVFVEKHNKFYRLYVAIADVSYYVKENSELDKSAFERGNSSYFPGFCSPMLPEKLSNDLCSLKEGKNRLTLVLEMDFNFQGEMIHSDLYSAVIKSHQRMTYGQVQEVLDQFSNQKEASQTDLRLPDEVIVSLSQAQSLAQVLIKKHIKELGFDLDIPEVLVLVDAQGEPQDILRERSLFPHKMIEHFMLSANKAVSCFLEKKQIPQMYRIHESPDPDKLKILHKFAQTLGFSKSFKKRKDFIQFLNQYKNHSQSSLIHKLVLRSFSQARYSAFNKGHYGLNYPSYTHFTSPIRRYCDLSIHRLIKQALKEESAPYPLQKSSFGKKELEKKAGLISAKEQNSVQAERRIKDIKTARFLEKYVGEKLIGSVSSVTSFGLFITLKAFFVEGLVRYQNIKGFWESDEFQLFVRNKNSGYRIQFGDEVEVLITACHIKTGQVDLKLLKHKGKDFLSV